MRLHDGSEATRAHGTITLVIDRDKHFRSVKPERIRTVHRIAKTRENAS